MENIVPNASETINPAAFPAKPATILGGIGTLQVRLATDKQEIQAAQSLRYKVFVEEMGARLPEEAMRLRRDFDHIDAYCDHLLVIDTTIDGEVEDQIVGTYRVLTQENADRHDGFYSQCEFDVESLITRHPEKRFMELGRSCVLPSYRTKRTLELLWQGNWAYALANGIDAMFGCASFPGDKPYRHALALSFLNQTTAGIGDWEVHAVKGRGVSMDMMPIEAINPRAALSAMPPLVKGYIRVGALVSGEAVVDKAFQTTDILVMLPVKQISERYINHYRADASRFAA